VRKEAALTFNYALFPVLAEVFQGPQIVFGEAPTSYRVRGNAARDELCKRIVDKL
jgi:hypothetical protein